MGYWWGTHLLLSPCEAAHYFLYIYIKRWSSFAGGRGRPLPPNEVSLLLFIINKKKKRHFG